MIQILVLAFLCSFSVPSRGEVPVGNMEHYLHSNDIRDVVTDGTTVWAIPHYGGLVKWDSETKTKRLYTRKDGLLSNAVAGAVLDCDNHLWIWFGDQASNESAAGFMVYDTGSWTTYTTADGLIDNNVTTIAIDSSNIAWIGTEAGVSRFDGSTWTSYDHFEMDSKPDPVTNIICGTDGTTYVATRNQYWQYINDTWTCSYFDSDKKGLALLRAMPDSSLWVCRHVGMGIQEIYTLKNMQKTTITYFGVENSECFFGLFTDDENKIWLEFEDDTNQVTGYLFYDGQDTTRITNIDNVPYYIGHKWVRDNSGRRWLATSDGMIVHENDRTDTLQCEGPAGNRIIGITVDSNGYPMLTTEHGISSYTGTQFTTQSSMRRNDLLSAEYTVDGIWAGTTNGIALYREGEWQPFYTVGEDSIKRVPAIIEDRTNVVWALSGEAGLIELIDGEIDAVYTDEFVATRQLSCIAVDSTNTKWIGGSRDLLSFDGTIWYNHTPALKELGGTGEIRALTVDPSNHIWALSTNQIYEYDGKSWILLSPDIAELDSHDFRAIAVDRDGIIWVGTFGDGVLVYDGMYWQQLTTKDGLTDNHIISIAIDSENRKWLGTNYGGISAFTQQTVPFVDSTAQHPEKFFTVSVYPNPFNPSTTISWTGSSDGPVFVRIYSITGQCVVSFCDDSNKASNCFRWNGRNTEGLHVASGIYVVHVSDEHHSTTAKLMLLH